MNGADELQIPQIRSTRGYRLYGADGRRYIDFYQNGGLALNGHRPAGILQALKSSAARGVWAEYPSCWRERVEKQLCEMFPFVDRIFFYPGTESALKDLSLYFNASVRIEDSPAGFWKQPESDGVAILRWRPFALSGDQSADLARGKSGEFFIPLIPFPGNFLPVPVCRIAGDFVPETFVEISPVLYSLMLKSISLTRQRTGQTDDMAWKVFDMAGVRRVGPYLDLGLSGESYAALFTEMLEKGILIPPSDRFPCIIPGEYNEGDVLPFIHALRRIYGNS